MLCTAKGTNSMAAAAAACAAVMSGSSLMPTPARSKPSVEESAGRGGGKYCWLNDKMDCSSGGRVEREEVLAAATADASRSTEA